MADARNLREQVESVISRYLRGEMEFDGAASELSEILRSIMNSPAGRATPGTPRARAPIRLRTLSVKDWMHPGESDQPAPIVLHARPLVAGGTAEEEKKAQALMDEAIRRAESGGGGAA